MDWKLPVSIIQYVGKNPKDFKIKTTPSQKDEFPSSGKNIWDIAQQLGIRYVTGGLAHIFVSSAVPTLCQKDVYKE